MIPLHAYVSAAVALAGFAAGWSVRDWKADAAALAQAKASNELRERMLDQVASFSAKYEQARAEQEPARVETRNTIKEIFRAAPPVAVDCAAPDAVVGVLVDATRRANAAASGQSGAELPAAAETPGGPDRP